MTCALYAAAFALAAALGITPPAKPQGCNGGWMD
jgi:hypothetical protein